MANAKYDIVVVGAGNAGLSAALQSALAGKKTLLIKQHNLPGGCATSFRRGRFEIEPSLHEICDLGPVENPGDVRTIMDQYGVKVEWRRVDDCFRMVQLPRGKVPLRRRPLLRCADKSRHHRLRLRSGQHQCRYPVRQDDPEGADPRAAEKALDRP